MASKREVAPRTNGHTAAAIPPPGPQIRQRFEWMPIGDEYYPEFRIKVWANMPHRLWLDLYSGDLPRLLAAAVLVAPEHNGWVDFDGKTMKPASTTAFWDELPFELFRMTLMAIDNARTVLPNSLMVTRQTSPSSLPPSSTGGAAPAV